MKATRINDIGSYRTRDGSEIRELMHPNIRGSRNQSLAHATLRPGDCTLLHKHPVAEEIYHFLSGSGAMTVGHEHRAVGKGDTVCIPPGSPHKVCNTGSASMEILCCCSPPYSHDDTVLLEP
jgi:mannose-6-phosphate isomerase-like protein (cupin superfamily)